MTTLTSKQKQYLKGLAHPLSPLVLIGKEGITDSLADAVANPRFLGVVDDDPKFMAEAPLHTAFRAVHQVAERVRSDNVTSALSDVVAAAKALDKDVDEALVRAVAHVKLAWRDGTLRDAKGYFGCWRRPLAWRFLRRRVDR